jgi:hypothetical protein
MLPENYLGDNSKLPGLALAYRGQGSRSENSGILSASIACSRLWNERMKELFRGQRCKECGSILLVSATYSRVLVAFAIIAAEALQWVGNVRKLFYSALGVEFGLFISVPWISRCVSDYSQEWWNGAHDPALHPATLSQSAHGHSHHSRTHSIAWLSVAAKTPVALKTPR